MLQDVFLIVLPKMGTYKIHKATQVGSDLRTFSMLQTDLMWATDCCDVSHIE
jgi:hypothetical protein